MKGAAAAGEEARATMSLWPSERAEVRRSRYKVVVDAEDGRRRREDNMVEIRKNRREESLLKKRRDDLSPSVVAAAPQMAHSSALQPKVCSASVSKELNAKHESKMEDVSMGMWIEKFNSTRQPVEYLHDVRFCQSGCFDVRFYQFGCL